VATRQAAGMLLPALLAVLASCAGFQGTRQVPLLRPVEQAAHRDAGPWLTPRFAPQADGTVSLLVSWITARPIPTRLAWGPDSASPEHPASPRMEGAEARTRLHRVTLSSLTPGTRSCYAVDFDGDGSADEPRHCFRAADWSRAPLTVAVLGDMQPKDALSRRNGRIMAQALAESGADLIIQLGDLTEIGALRSHWLDSLENLSVFASRIPTVGAIGNHDYYGDPGRNFRALFPYEYADERAAFWSFQAAGAHFVVLDCFEEDGAMSAAQKAWVEADLKIAAQRRLAGEVGWVFMILHPTPLTTGTSEPAGELERWLLPLADRSGVDAVFFGHDHHYEHWELVYGSEDLVFDPGDEPSHRPVHYFCSGGGGAHLEIDYGLLPRKPRTCTRRRYARRLGQGVKRRYLRLPGDASRYIDRDGRHYYHLPAEASYQGDTGWLGYGYGEQTLHYLLIRLGADEAVVSAHYPGGQLLAGPHGDLPQRFTIPARR